MIRLVPAELLKLRRRWATYVVLAVLIGLMALVYVLVGLTAGARPRSNAGEFLTQFPGAFSVIGQFVFGLGSLLAVAYAAAVAGSDWSWGVMRIVVARGESRAGYILAKAIGLAIVLFLGVIIAFLAGIVLTYMTAALTHTDVGSPFAGDSMQELVKTIGSGYLVLLERAAIGFAVAVLLRSQLAGVVVGIVLYIGEAILSSILVVIELQGAVQSGGVPRTLGTQWYQFLPFSIGSSVISSRTTTSSDVGSLVLTPVAFELAVAVTLGYLIVALGVSMLFTERVEISS